MGDGQSCLLLHYVVERLLHLSLVLRIQGRGGLVQEKNLWVSKYDSSYGHSLLLSTWDILAFRPTFLSKPSPLLKCDIFWIHSFLSFMFVSYFISLLIFFIFAFVERGRVFIFDGLQRVVNDGFIDKTTWI